MSGPEAGSTPDAIRAHVPGILDAYSRTRAEVLETGVVDTELKRLCARYLNGDDELADFERSAGLREHERAALGWAHAIAWDPATADDDLWKRLHEHFTEPELVELGYCIAIVHGQLRWLRALGLHAPNDAALGF